MGGGFADERRTLLAARRGVRVPDADVVVVSVGAGRSVIADDGWYGAAYLWGVARLLSSSVGLSACCLALAARLMCLFCFSVAWAPSLAVLEES